MGKKSKLVALVAGASLLLGTFGLAACAPENDDKTGNNVPEDIYAIYTAYAETAGEDAMTYDEWYAHLLETAKGDDGKSAYDIWKENGHSGTEAEFLEWLKGDVGPEGKAGTKWFTGEDDEPSADLGAEGDFYLNTKTFDLWTKKTAWTKLGCIKGADAGSEESPQYKVVKDFGSKTINTEEVPLDLNDVENDTYFLVVESDSEAVAKNLTSVIGGTNNYDMYCSLTNGYKSVVVKGDDTTLSLKATQSVTGNVKLIEYSAPAIKKAGETYEVPVLHRNYGYVEIDIDSSFRGHSVNVVCHNYVGIKGISIGKCDSSHTTFGSMTKDTNDKTLFTKTINIPADCEKIYFDSSELNKNGNITVQITLAD